MDICYFARMKKLLNFLKIDFYFVVFLFFMSYLLSINSRLSVGQDFLSVIQPDAPIIHFLGVFVIMFIIKLTVNYTNKRSSVNLQAAKSYILYFVLSFVVYLLFTNLFGFIVAYFFNTIPVNFNGPTLLSNNIERTVDFTLFGSIYLAYLFFKENKQYRSKINALDKVMAASNIQQLKAQLNPHFLFNNLNTLDELIEEDQAKASAFLHHFAELYRYSLVTSEKKLVPLAEELQFVNNYFELMEHKYKGYYHLSIENHQANGKFMVPPFCLQVLVENAIEHNFGRKEKPVEIHILIDQNISTSNTVIPKQHKKKEGGRALKNLSTQFKLLSGKDILIKKDETQFTVQLPLISSEQNA